MAVLGGTPDYNTSPLQDTRILVSSNFSLSSAAQTTLGPYYVQQNGHIFVLITPSGSPVARFVVFFDAYADAALTKLIDTRSYVFNSNLSFKQMVPVLGAYLQIRLQTNNVTANSTAVLVSVDSRSDALGLFNRGRSLVSSVPLSVVGGGNTTVDLVPTVGGPGMFYWQFTGTAYSISMWTQDFGGNQTFLLSFSNTTAPGNRLLSVVWPAGLIQLSLTNSDAGAQTFHIIAVLA